MEPIFGFLLFALAAVIVSMVAKKRGRSAIGVFAGVIVGGFALVFLTSASGNPQSAGFVAFLSPFIGLLFAVGSKSSEQITVETGSHGEFKKCPFCAESVRREAIKCKHCGSALEEFAQVDAV